MDFRSVKKITVTALMKIFFRIFQDPENSYCNTYTKLI